LTNGGGIVNGILYDEDGLPFPNAPIYLWEYDEDLLKTYGGGLDSSRYPHMTQKRITNQNGEFSFDYVMFNNKNFTVDARNPDNTK